MSGQPHTCIQMLASPLRSVEKTTAERETKSFLKQKSEKKGHIFTYQQLQASHLMISGMPLEAGDSDIVVVEFEGLGHGL